MATIQKVNYFAMQMPNRAGEAARVLTALAKSGVNLLAFTGFPAGRGAQVDFVPASAASFLKAAHRLKLRLRAKKIVFLIRGKDKRGAIGALMAKLASSRINVTAVEAVSAGGGRFGALLWVKQKDVSRAARVLNAR